VISCNQSNGLDQCVKVTLSSMSASGLRFGSLTRHVATKWLKTVEKLAGLTRVGGGFAGIMKIAYLESDSFLEA